MIRRNDEYTLDVKGEGLFGGPMDGWIKFNDLGDPNVHVATDKLHIRVDDGQIGAAVENAKKIACCELPKDYLKNLAKHKYDESNQPLLKKKIQTKKGKLKIRG